MIVLATIGFVVLSILGVMFLFAGVACLWWDSNNGHHDMSWLIPIGIGAWLIYLASVFSPFTISVGVV